MTDPLYDASDGSTPIEHDEAIGLHLTWVRTRRDLNDAEAANILQALQTIRPPALENVTDDLWLRQLHKRMFGDVWSWAGRYRLTDRNIGVGWERIAPAVRMLCQDCRAWCAVEHTLEPVARFHHRLVAIHPFPNGNGRHARAAADYLCLARGQPSPTWGMGRYGQSTELRAAYLSALRSADKDPDDLGSLMSFMWS